MRRLIAGIVALFGINGAISAPEQLLDAKQINYRGGLVVFSVPITWAEEFEPEGGGVFYEPGDNTGTLRLNVISAKPPTSDTISSSKVLSDFGHPVSEILPNGNAISKSVLRETDRGKPITIYWWYVVNVVADHVRIANFSYTILSSEEHSAVTISELSLLENSIRNASFGPVVGK